jgi:hypothetical protein
MTRVQGAKTRGDPFDITTNFARPIIKLNGFVIK